MSIKSYSGQVASRIKSQTYEKIVFKVPFLSRALLLCGPSAFSSFKSSIELHFAMASTSASSDIECDPVKKKKFEELLLRTLHYIKHINNISLR